MLTSLFKLTSSENIFDGTLVSCVIYNINLGKEVNPTEAKFTKSPQQVFGPDLLHLFKSGQFKVHEL